MKKTAMRDQPLKARPFKFDFSHTPLQWIPTNPYASHLISVLHMIAPVGERRFMKAVQDALPYIEDERLRAEIRGFIGQEAAHAHVHYAALDHLKRLGVDTTDYLKMYEQLYDFVAGEKPVIPIVPDRLWTSWRLAYTAAAEQITCVLGDWALDAIPLDEPETDKEMASFLRWHGAEEVEHRSVAFEALQHVAGPVEYPVRAGAMLTLFPILIVLWYQGTQYLIERDPDLQGRQFSFLDYLSSVQRGHAPGWELLSSVGRFLQPNFHPVHEGRPDLADAFMAKAPAR